MPSRTTWSPSTTRPRISDRAAYRGRGSHLRRAGAVGRFGILAAAIEIVPGEGAFDYTAKYLLKSTQEICPGRFSPEFTTESCKAHRALSCAGYSRTDFIVSAKGPIYLHPARCCSQATRYANLETKGGAEIAGHAGRRAIRHAFI
jgi:hypothetical protein